MKLAELKTGLIDHFFTEDSIGVNQNEIDAVFESIGTSLGINLSVENVALISQQVNRSSDPSKAFKRFTEGRVALLTITEEDGIHENSILAAVRAGTHVKIMDLTTKPMTEKKGGLTVVKQALRQAKDRNDDVFFNLIITDSHVIRK